MNRSSQHQAIILRVTPLGDTHATADLLTPEEGLLRATVYGLRGKRSSLRGLVVPFARGTAWFYRDPRRETVKLNDFSVERYALVLQSDLRAYYHASLYAEVLWRSHASGDGGAESYRLIGEALDLLEANSTPSVPGETLPAGAPPRRDEAWYRRLTILVLWRYLAVLGLQPDLCSSEHGGRALGAEERRFYDIRESVVVGEEWADPGMIELPPGAVRFLKRAEGASLAQAVTVQLAPAALAALRTVVLAAVQEAIHVPLNTIRVAGGWI